MTSHRPNSNLGSGGAGAEGPGPHPPPGPARAAAGAGESRPLGGGVEQRVRRAAQRRCLPGVSHHVREGGARADAGDGSALPAVVGAC